jgi:hypothetical protein
MTYAEKAQRLQDMAEHPYSYNMSNGDAEIAAECAAHFRALVPDANGLLPCPMCGPTSEATASGTFRGDHTVFCAAWGLRIGHYCSRREAAEAWNRRGGIAAVVKPPSGQHVLGYIDFLEAWVVVHCDDAGMWRCAWDGEQLCDDVTYWQELPADPERKKQEDDDA